MKKIIALIASVAVFAGLWSCTPDEKPVVPGIDLTGEATFNVPAADVPTISIAFVSTVAWTAEASDEWVTIAPKSGDAGEATVKVNVDDNKLADPRSLKVTITAGEVVKEVTINQEGAFVPYFDVEPASCQFSAWGGEPFAVEQKADDYVIPVSTNLEWDVYLVINDQVVLTNGWLTVGKSNAGITLTVSSDNETYDQRIEYVYVACHVGDDYETYGGFGACILVVQAGLSAPTEPELVWTKKYSDINENIAASVNTRLAWSEGKLLLSDGAAVYAIDAETGAFSKKYDIAVQSIDSDDEGNLLIMKDVSAEYDDGGNVIGPKEFKLMWTSSIETAPTAFYTMDYTNQAWGTHGNFRVRGNMATGKAVISDFVAGPRFYYAWAFDKGTYVKTADFDPIRGSFYTDSDGGTTDQCVALPVAPDNLTDGILMRGYTFHSSVGGNGQNIYLRTNPTVPFWEDGVEFKLLSEYGGGGNECQNNLDILDFGSKRILAFTQGGHFGWIGNANIYVLDITNLEDVGVIAVIESETWVDMDNSIANRGADVLLRANGNYVELYAARANGASVAKFIFGLE